MDIPSICSKPSSIKSGFAASVTGLPIGFASDRRRGAAATTRSVYSKSRVKDVYLYPLIPHVREVLSDETRRYS
ncbi:hypothetical protein PN4B1_47860 [Paenibacillus naphthalenovorans]|nr:hypothetical protein PN4B1_47860 [Paenibacillus naphthalenovorans]